MVQALRRYGYDVFYVMEDLRGTVDSELLTRAHDERRIVITEDKDFGELVYRLRLPARGIILLRFAIDERLMKIPRLLELLDSEGHRLSGSFIVLESDKTRVRPLR
jgi:predicted nuclease of predicted toxin-antitoxin system